mmetsp:Transcript_87723/g.272523  ORF Transcript_87723/g.272523 Transcript_87723/m.272523 type:complete len:729 (+) Transcript_87723:1235-3421(+)
MRVAGGDLLAVAELAGLPAAPGGLLDAPVPGPLAAAAGAAAAAPLGPLVPLAVLLGAGQVLLAGHGLRQGRAAAQAAGAAAVEHHAHALLLAGPAARGAGLPAGPVGKLAVLGAARRGGAAPRLHELCRAVQAALGRVAVDLPVPVLLAAAAGLLALVPLRPLGDAAVHRRHAAGLRLLEATSAWASTVRPCLHGALAVALTVGTAAGPGAPSGQHAVSLRGLARLRVAHLQLLQRLIAERAAALGRLGDTSVACLPTSAAGPRAGAPLAPVRELAGLRVAGLRAGRRLVERARAGRAVLHGHLLNGPVAEPLPVGVRALAPFSPLRELAGQRNVASRLAPLRLHERPLRGHAALVVHDRDTALALAESEARGLGPLAPGAKLAVPGLALLLAWLRVRALLHVQLRPRAGSAAAADEEVLLRAPRQAQGAVPQRGARAAARAAAAGLRPLGPGAEEVLVAMAGAVGDLLGALNIAELTAVVGHLVDGAVPPPLAFALGALAPLSPLAPLAIDAWLHRATGLRVARCRHRKAVRDDLATVLGHRQKAAGLHFLASTTRTAATTPVCPVAQHGILLRMHTGGRGLAGWPRVARLHLLQAVRLAGLAVARGEDLDGAVALADAEARTGAVGPLLPVGEGAIGVRHASGQVAARGVLFPDTDNGLATLIGVLRNLPAARAEAAAAGGGALRPLEPGTPESVDASRRAGLRVAGHGLALGQRLAERTTVPRCR